jgi:hypothetical protein
MKAILRASLFLLALSSIALGQQDTGWTKMNWLIGHWVGEGNGVPGQGSGWFSLLPDLGEKILIRKSHSEYPATKDKPLIIHDDLMIVHHAGGDQPDQADYFDNEGHAIHYAIGYSRRSVVFTSQATTSAPIFRLTYDPVDNETLSVTFEMSQDGRVFKTYTEGRCRRKQ